MSMQCSNSSTLPLSILFSDSWLILSPSSLFVSLSSSTTCSSSPFLSLISLFSTHQYYIHLFLVFSHLCKANQIAEGKYFLWGDLLVSTLKSQPNCYNIMINWREDTHLPKYNLFWTKSQNRLFLIPLLLFKKCSHNLYYICFSNLPKNILYQVSVLWLATQIKCYIKSCF